MRRLFPLTLFLASCTASISITEPLPTGRDITPPASFTQSLGSLPINLAVTPDHRFAVTTDAGYRESLHLLDLRTARSLYHLDFPNKPPKNQPVGEDTPNPVVATNGLYYGLAIAPSGKDHATLYAAQGSNDSIAVIAVTPNHEKKPALTQLAAIPTRTGDFPAGLALDNRDLLYVANQSSIPKPENPREHPGSIAIYNTTTHAEIGRYTFKDSYFGTTNYPLALAVLPDGSKLFVASERDAAVYSLDTSNPQSPKLLKKIPVGSHPSSLLLNKNSDRLFVANADSDTISIINSRNDTVTSTINLRPDVARDLPGASPLGITLSPDESTLYVALADMNAIAVVDLPEARVEGYIPTAWYPTALTLTPDNKLLVVSAKGSSARNPNVPPHRKSVLDILEGNAQLLTIPTGDALHESTLQVLDNNHYERLARPIPEPLASITRKSGKITHVIYIIKENRTYDQVLGDINTANGDPNLCLFPEPVTPNQHALAKRFGILDNLYACGEVSGDGWNWSTESMANPYVVRNVPYYYSHRGRARDFEGLNNDYPTGGLPARKPDGSRVTTRPAFLSDAATPAIPDVGAAPGGHLWDLCNAHNVPFRNYGMYCNAFGNLPTAKGLMPADHNLAGKTDIDYCRFLLEYPDSEAPTLLAIQHNNPDFLSPYKSFGKFGSASRFTEWNREFQLMLQRDPNGRGVPNLMLLRLPNNHTHGTRPGSPTPTAFIADNDFAVGQIVESISHSPIWPHCAIFIIEDDAQDGPDHVDCHRTVGLVISPYLKPASPGNSDSHFYNTNSFLRTMEVLLDLPPMTQYDATATLINNWTAIPQNTDPYTATMPDAKYFLQRNPKKSASMPPESRRLAEASEQMNFTTEDAADAQLLNQAIWHSLHPITPMPQPKTTHLLGAGFQQKDDDD